MKLDLDCIRDILIAVEDIEYGKNLTISILQEKIPNYSENELQYHCLKLLEGGFLDATSVEYIRTPKKIVRIFDLTYEGHQFLADIRSDTTWNRTKEVAKNIRIESLHAVKDIAVATVTALIQNKMGLSWYIIISVSSAFFSGRAF